MKLVHVFIYCVLAPSSWPSPACCRHCSSMHRPLVPASLCLLAGLSYAGDWSAVPQLPRAARVTRVPRVRRAAQRAVSHWGERAGHHRATLLSLQTQVRTRTRSWDELFLKNILIHEKYLSDWDRHNRHRQKFVFWLKMESRDRDMLGIMFLGRDILVFVGAIVLLYWTFHFLLAFGQPGQILLLVILGYVVYEMNWEKYILESFQTN